MRFYCTLLIFSLCHSHYSSQATPAVQQLQVQVESDTPAVVQLNEHPAARSVATDADDDDDEWFIDGRIVGGLPTSILNFPYQVSVQYKGHHICGGAIIRPKVIITAAHCVEPTMLANAFQVRAGSSHHAYGGQLLTVHHIYRHAGYSSATHNHDVALLQLSQELQYTQTVQPVALATAHTELAAKAKLFVSGWGLTSETGYVSALLNYVDVNLIRHETCVQNYKYVVPITAEMFCAGYKNGGKDSCQGDSGGPLVANYRGVATLYGIVSWGIGCAQKDYPGVYVKVSALRLWIDEQLANIDAASGRLW